MYRNPDIKDKFICAAFYASIFVPILSWAPIIWIIYSNIKKVYLKDFIKYHCYQAFLFSMIGFFLPSLFDLVISLVLNLLDLFSVFANSILLLGEFKAWILKIYFVLLRVAALYAIVWTARGKFTYLPPISQAVNLLLR